MLVEVCSQERSYLRFYGLLGQVRYSQYTLLVYHQIYQYTWLVYSSDTSVYLACISSDIPVYLAHTRITLYMYWINSTSQYVMGVH